MPRTPKRRQDRHIGAAGRCRLRNARLAATHTRTEIGDQAGPVGVQQDVLRLDVTVDNVMLVQVQQSRRHFAHPLLPRGESVLDQRNRTRQVAPDLPKL